MQELMTRQKKFHDAKYFHKKVEFPTEVSSHLLFFLFKIHGLTIGEGGLHETVE